MGMDSSICGLRGWQVSANIGLNCDLNQFKLVWQKQVSDSFCQCTMENWSFVIVCSMETLLLTNIKPE